MVNGTTKVKQYHQYLCTVYVQYLIHLYNIDIMMLHLRTHRAHEKTQSTTEVHQVDWDTCQGMWERWMNVGTVMLSCRIAQALFNYGISGEQGMPFPHT